MIGTFFHIFLTPSDTKPSTKWIKWKWVDFRSMKPCNIIIVCSICWELRPISDRRWTRKFLQEISNLNKFNSIVLSIFVLCRHWNLFVIAFGFGCRSLFVHASDETNRWIYYSHNHFHDQCPRSYIFSNQMQLPTWKVINFLRFYSKLDPRFRSLIIYV